MFTTAKKRGKVGSRPGTKATENDHSPATMYSAAEFGGGKPDSSRRLTGNYGKTAGKRGDYKPEVGNRSRETGRMFNWMKGESY